MSTTAMQDPIKEYTSAVARDWQALRDECLLPPAEWKKCQAARTAAHAKFEREVALRNAQEQMSEARYALSSAMRAAGDPIR